MSPCRRRQRQTPFAETTIPTQRSRPSSEAILLGRGPDARSRRRRSAPRPSRGADWASAAFVARGGAAPRAHAGRPEPSSGSRSSDARRRCGRPPTPRPCRRGRTTATGSRRGRHPQTCGSLLSSDLVVEGESEPGNGRHPATKGRVPSSQASLEGPTVGTTRRQSNLGGPSLGEHSRPGPVEVTASMSNAGLRCGRDDQPSGQLR